MVFRLDRSNIYVVDVVDEIDGGGGDRECVL